MDNEPTRQILALADAVPRSRHAPPQGVEGRRDPKFLAVITLQASDTNRKSEDADARAFADQQVTDARKLHPRITQRWGRMPPAQKARLHARLWANSQQLYEKRLRAAGVAVDTSPVPVPRLQPRAVIAVRTAPRHLGVRRHRRAARRLQKAAGDDSGPEPPPLKAVLLVACAAEALGFAVGAIAATVVP